MVIQPTKYAGGTKKLVFVAPEGAAGARDRIRFYDLAYPIQRARNQLNRAPAVLV
jgi:hypothetical protein